MKLFVCVNYVILLKFLFDNIYVLLSKHICNVISLFRGRRSGGAGVGAQSQFSGRACRRSQNSPASTAGYKFGGAGKDALSSFILTYYV
jgi:hypothetical protein